SRARLAGPRPGRPPDLPEPGGPAFRVRPVSVRLRGALHEVRWAPQTRENLLCHTTIDAECSDKSGETHERRTGLAPRIAWTGSISEVGMEPARRAPYALRPAA